MMGKNFLISILIGALFYGCEKPTDYTLDNKKDPENKDYIPTEPDSLIVFKNADKIPNLVWRDNSEAESGFLIKKKIGSAEFSLVESITFDQNNWTDESYKPSEPIVYGIQAYNDNGESDLVVTTPLLSYLNVDLEINGSGKVSLSNLSELTDSVLYGTELSLLAEPENCWNFLSWNDKVFETSNTYVVTTDTTIRANFVENTIGYEIQTNTSGQGEIILEPNKATYSCGEVVEIEAVPSEGWEFVEWSGDVSETSETFIVDVGSDLDITAVFTENPLFKYKDGIITCDEAELGESGAINGIVFIKRSRDQINYTNAPYSCTSGIVNMERMFERMATFNGDISHWDVSSVTNMAGMFFEASNFNIDISHWDVSSVENMEYMFAYAREFNQDVGKWDVASVINMENMFYVARSFSHNLTGWCVPQIWGEPDNFASFSSLSDSDAPNWGSCNGISHGFSLDKNNTTIVCNDAEVGVSAKKGTVEYTKRRRSQITRENAQFSCTSGITDMSNLFEGQIISHFSGNISHWDVSSVTNMYGLFWGASVFNHDLSNWDVSNVTNMGRMFAGAERFESDLRGWDVGNVTDMHYMFAGAERFESDLSNWDVSNVTNMDYMFSWNGFSGNLSNWCVAKIVSEPEGFVYSNNNFLAEHKPIWGTCPSD